MLRSSTNKWHAYVWYGVHMLRPKNVRRRPKSSYNIARLQLMEPMDLFFRTTKIGFCKRWPQKNMSEYTELWQNFVQSVILSLLDIIVTLNQSRLIVTIEASTLKV